MAEQNTDLTEKLKSLAANKPTDKFTAPPEAPTTVTDPITEPLLTPPVITTEPIKLTDVVPPVTELKKVNPSLDVHTENLIRQAEKFNQKLNNKELEFTTAVTNAILTKSAKAKQILKDCGMDSQMVERAYNELTKLALTD